MIFKLVQEQEQIVKVAISILLLVPLGILMGMPFPALIRRTSEFAPQMVSWCWGLNGAASVLGSVSAVIVALNAGFSASLLIGALAYAAALVCVWMLPEANVDVERISVESRGGEMARVGTPGV
jgi:hypothetical protein